ncbi:MAG: hypothetical protein WCW52_03000 [Elusimicrobiales bacterium]|jgi:hypothetical protein
MKRITIKIAIAGISALFIMAVLLKPQHLTGGEASKKQTVVHYTSVGVFPNSPLFYAEN